MSAEPQIGTPNDEPGGQSVEMPRPTVAPIVLSLGLSLLGAGVVFGFAFLVAGAVVFVVGLGLWIASLLPGKGHMHEALATSEERAQPVVGTPGLVEQLLPGRPGYRIQMPQMVHPTSAGVRGGILGGLVIPIPALIYGVVSGHGIFYPVNLLAGMLVPGVDKYSLTELDQFHPLLLVVGIVIHAAVSITFGLLYGVLLPTLPSIPKPIAWGGLLMPLFWTAVSFSLMGVVNPTLKRGVDWPSFVLSQFIFGMVAAIVVMRARHLRPLMAGVLGGLIGGVLMPVPAVLWGLLTERGIWYPVNLLAGMVDRSIGQQSLEELKLFHAEWLITALVLHAALSLVFGIVYGLALPKLPVIPGPMCWGSLLMPMLWTGISFGLMGVVNPVLQERVNWPWFIVSQFIFGLVASIAVIRSETIPIPPAGTGPTPSPAGHEV
jgi:hypothetical protein